MSAVPAVRTAHILKFPVRETAAVGTGLLITSVVPAIVWTAAIAGIGHLLGYAPSRTALLVAAVAIASLLACVYCALCLQKSAR